MVSDSLVLMAEVLVVLVAEPEVLEVVAPEESVADKTGLGIAVALELLQMQMDDSDCMKADNFVLAVA